jgi:F0F1-type ATP synthase assembly protein I
MKLRVRAFGMASGLISGVVFCLGTLYSLLFGAGEAFTYFAFFLPYLTRTPFGVAYGLLAGFVEGFLIGAIFAWLYNRFCRMFYGSKEAG